VSYPFAFRRLVVDAYHRGEGSLAELASEYDISIPTLREWLSRARQKGDLNARTSPGRPPKLGAAARNALRDLLAADNDATLPMLAHELWQRTGARVSRQTIGRTLQQLDLTRKKSPSTLRNAGALPSCSLAASVAVESHASTQRA